MTPSYSTTCNLLVLLTLSKLYLNLLILVNSEVQRCLIDNLHTLVHIWFSLQRIVHLHCWLFWSFTCKMLESRYLPPKKRVRLLPLFPSKTKKTGQLFIYILPFHNGFNRHHVKSVYLWIFLTFLPNLVIFQMASTTTGWSVVEISMLIEGALILS